VNSRTAPLRALRAAILAVLSLSCFEQPVQESLVLKFLPGDGVVVGIAVKLAPEDAFKDNRAARERIQALRRDLQENRDDWSRRIASLEPALQRTVWDMEAGNLQSVSRRIALEHAEDLTRFFSDTLIRAQITRRDGEAELQLTPGPGSRASRSQRDEFETRRKAWIDSYSRYLRAVSRLYAYLEEHPSRDAICFAAVFEEEVDAVQKEALGPPSQEEQELTDAVRRAVEETLDLFSLPTQSPYSLEELSRLVYDPFPAPLIVQLPGPILQSEGFVDQGSQVLKVPERSLWEALRGMRDRWVVPDLMQLKYRLQSDNQPLDLGALSNAKRSFIGPPSPAEIRQAFEEYLTPAPRYLVRWSTRGLKELDPAEGIERLWQLPTLPQD